MYLRIELCADELVVGGGVGWSYDRRRRRGFMVGGDSVCGVRPVVRAVNSALAGQVFFFLVLQGSVTSPVISARPLAPKS